MVNNIFAEKNTFKNNFVSTISDETVSHVSL